MPRCLLGLSISPLLDVLPKLVSLDESLNLIFQLEAFLNIVTMVMMVAVVLLLVLPNQ